MPVCKYPKHFIPLLYDNAIDIDISDVKRDRGGPDEGKSGSGS